MLGLARQVLGMGWQVGVGEGIFIREHCGSVWVFVDMGPVGVSLCIRLFWCGFFALSSGEVSYDKDSMWEFMKMSLSCVGDAVVDLKKTQCE